MLMQAVALAVEQVQQVQQVQQELAVVALVLAVEKVTAKVDETNLTCKVIDEKISTFFVSYTLSIRHQGNKNDVQTVDRNRAYLKFVCIWCR